jgi:hypothetical protein
VKLEVFAKTAGVLVSVGFGVAERLEDGGREEDEFGDGWWGGIVGVGVEMGEIVGEKSKTLFIGLCFS